MGCRCIVALLLTVSVCRAGWNTNAWPAADFQRAGKLQATDVYNALMERAQAVSRGGIVDSPAWYRSQRSLLVDWKSDLEDLVDDLNYIQTNKTFDGTNTFLELSPAWKLTVTGLLVTLEMPTNYFDYTPWRCLNGSGPYTNDATDYATLGHGYGWTNATTADGGTVPTNRTAWRTTDYGWQGMHDVLNEMVWTYGLGKGTNYQTWSTNAYTTNAVCDVSRTNHMVAFQLGTWEDGGSYVYQSWGDYIGFVSPPDVYEFEAHRERGQALYDDSSGDFDLGTNAAHEADVYIYFERYGLIDTFSDADGLGASAESFLLYETFAAAVTNARLSRYVGAYDGTNYLDESLIQLRPVTCADSNIRYGMQSGEDSSITPFFVHRWNVTNGFEYVK